MPGGEGAGVAGGAGGVAAGGAAAGGSAVCSAGAAEGASVGGVTSSSNVTSLITFARRGINVKLKRFYLQIFLKRGVMPTYNSPFSASRLAQQYNSASTLIR